MSGGPHLLLSGGGPPPRSSPSRSSPPRLLLLLLASSVLGVACGDGPAPPIEARLAAIPGLTVTEEATTLSGYRYFVMTYQQPADHHQPQSAWFAQRLALLHRDEAAPMILYTSGYHLPQSGGRTELTRMVNGNQLALEHRFFLPSRPDPPDWRHLTIEQAAADQHRVVLAFREIYRGRWLSTGGSKGGLTAIFHRRFYPNDVDGTVAYSAPLAYEADGVQSPTNRYIAFVNQVGTDPACRQALRDFQRQVLTRREEIFPLMDDFARETATTFDHLGKRKALEFAVEDAPFGFWQYLSADDCARVPGPGATALELFQFLDDAAGIYFYSNEGILTYLPYYHQAATQLGYPIDEDAHLSDLLVYPEQRVARAYLPADVFAPSYDPESMVDIQGWVARDGARLLFLYGENDPWSAGAFELGQARDSFRLFVAGGNHRAKIADLSPEDRSIAFDAVSRWSAVVAVTPPAEKPGTATAGQTETDPLEEQAPLRGGAAGPGW